MHAPLNLNLPVRLRTYLPDECRELRLHLQRPVGLVLLPRSLCAYLPHLPVHGEEMHLHSPWPGGPQTYLPHLARRYTSTRPGRVARGPTYLTWDL